MWPRTDTTLPSDLSAPSVPEHEVSRADSFCFETLTSPIVSVRLPFRPVLPRAALSPAGADICSSPSPEDG